MSPVEVLGAAEGAGASRRGARAKLKKEDFWKKNCRIGWIFRSELRVATHICRISYIWKFSTPPGKVCGVLNPPPLD